MMHILRKKQFEERVPEKSFLGQYVNFKDKIKSLESSFSALSYDTSIKKIEPGITRLFLFKVKLAFP